MSADRFAEVERLYLEALLTPTLTLRVGEVYTPFGLWNVVRRAPLTWTTERPAITESVFPQHATGLSLLYQATWHGWSIDAVMRRRLSAPCGARGGRVLATCRKKSPARSRSRCTVALSSGPSAPVTPAPISRSASRARS